VTADDRRLDPRYERLLDITRELSAQGYDAVSMRELANLMHMSLTTIYQLGGSKDQLIAEAHAERMAKFREAVHRRPPRGAKAEDRVRRVLRQYVSTLDRDSVRTLTMMRAFYALTPDVLESRASVHRTYVDLIDEAVGDTDVPDRLIVIETLGHVMNSAIVQWMNDEAHDKSEVWRVLDEAVHVLFRDVD
jgi:AcrR family transcriptional regulator